MKRSRYGKVVACLMVLALVGLSFFPARVAAQGDDPSDGIELRRGLLIHPTLNVAYVMTPEGITAVDLATGAKQWTSTAAAKPLTLAGNLLISQVEQQIAGNRLELVALNIQQRGAPVVRGVTELPPGVNVSIGETLKGRFAIDAHPSAGGVLVTWDFQQVQRRGMREIPSDAQKESGPDAEKMMPSQRLVKQSATGGTLQMSLTTGAITRQDNMLLQVRQPLRRSLSPTEKIADAAPVQYESADGRHILASERVADDRVWDKYLWTVYERSTRRRVGEFRNHVSFTPFVIRDSLVLFETTPFIRRGAAQEPAKLRAVSLSAGQELWSVEVREIVHRGPFPP